MPGMDTVVKGQRLNDVVLLTCFSSAVKDELLSETTLMIGYNENLSLYYTINPKLNFGASTPKDL